jgi:hypothetical protein
MARVTGTISDGATILYRDVLINLNPNTSGSRLGFRGVFKIPHGSTLVSSGQSLDLKCSDGRAGQIIVSRVQYVTGQSATIGFEINGQF